MGALTGFCAMASAWLQAGSARIMLGADSLS
jgi:hypothetical protein